MVIISGVPIFRIFTVKLRLFWKTADKSADPDQMSNLVSAKLDWGILSKYLAKYKVKKYVFW